MSASGKHVKGTVAPFHKMLQTNRPWPFEEKYESSILKFTFQLPKILLQSLIFVLETAI
jgi:hypothetical protein